MTASLLRVINSQTIIRSILLDKIDESQGNSMGYALKPKQKLYIPYVNPVDAAVAGYVDLVQTDNIQLAQAAKGVIAGLVAAGRITTASIHSSQIATPVVSGAVHASGETSVTGTTFLSVAPDHTYVRLTNLSGVSQTFSDTQLSTGALTDLVALSNSLKTIINAHMANTGGVWHTNADVTNPIATAAATDLATAITLLNQIKVKYEAHRVLIAGPTHSNADAVNTITAADATDMASAVTLSDMLKLKFNTHRSQATVHALNDTVNVVTLTNGDAFSNTNLQIRDSDVTIGTPATGWIVRVQANSRFSNNSTI